MPATLVRRAVSEGIGTAFLLAAIVGSGIMGERLSGGDQWQTLLANSLTTGAALVALILALRSTSGAHLNPLVTMIDAALTGRPWREVPAYLLAQLIGAFVGVAAAHGMFGEPVLSVSRKARAGFALEFSEWIATAGLLLIVFATSRRGVRDAALAIGSYITAAYWFTASTSFANPAVTLARALTDSFAGIRPADVPGFLAAQLAAAAGVTLLLRWLTPRRPENPPTARATE